MDVGSHLPFAFNHLKKTPKNPKNKAGTLMICAREVWSGLCKAYMFLCDHAMWQYVHFNSLKRAAWEHLVHPPVLYL